MQYVYSHRINYPINTSEGKMVIYKKLVKMKLRFAEWLNTGEKHVLKHLIRVLNLPAGKVEIFGSRLQVRNFFFFFNTKISVSKKRNRRLSSSFANVESLYFRESNNELLEDCGIPHDREKWGHFIDDTNTTLKAA